MYFNLNVFILKTLKTIIGVFAVIGFVVVASGFSTNNATQDPTYGTPESHVWEMTYHGTGSVGFFWNKEIGEVRRYGATLAKYIVTVNKADTKK